MSTTATVNAGEILHHTAAFVTSTLSHPNLRRRLVSLLLLRLPPTLSSVDAKTLTLAADSVDSAAAATATLAGRSSSLSLAETLAISLPETALSSLLLSLIHGLTGGNGPAALAVLDIFRLDPSAARSDVAAALFEDLFLLRLLPVLRAFHHRRCDILSPESLSSTHIPIGDDELSSVAVVPSAKSLSKMSEKQASELKELEREYEEVLDQNCRVLAEYFKEVLLLEINDNGNNRLMESPSLIVKTRGKLKMRDDGDENDGKPIGTCQDSINGRYNPIWTEIENSVEFFNNNTGRSKSNFIQFNSYYPQRVSPETFSDQKYISNSEVHHCSLDDKSIDYSSSSSESKAETEENNRKIALFTQKQEQPILAESSCSPDTVAVTNRDKSLSMPPKDFVCPITSNVFADPVTLETGQTYERNAIQEWLERGNFTCPITRQKLQNTQLPKTNYVLKRLIASWQEHNKPENLYKEDESIVDTDSCSTSPHSVTTQASMEGTIAELRYAISSLCTSEILKESETAVLRIERFWNEVSNEEDVRAMLSKPAVINGFVEILFNSVDLKVLRATIFLLCELGSRDNSVIQTLTQVDSDVRGVAALFKQGLVEAVVLIYLLRESIMNLVELNLVESLLELIKNKESEPIKMWVRPKTAAVILLGQIIIVANAAIPEKAIESFVDSLESKFADERVTAVRILIKCMKENGECRNIIANRAKLGLVLESLVDVRHEERFEIVLFLSELVKLNRRTFNEQVLHIIRDEGSLCTMHTLLVYLQTAPEDQCPIIASLLLQLDLLSEPRKMSIFREEAIDSLIACLRNTEFPGAQLAAAKAILSFQGRFTASGKSLTRAFLLKRVGFNNKSYNSLARDEESQQQKEEEEKEEEEKVAENWERKTASVLVAHEFGLLFEALSEGMKSSNAELSSACFVSATWLANMLESLPDTGVRGAACVCLLKRFVSVFRSSRDTEDKALSLLALRSFIQDPEGVSQLTSYLKDILKGLRELKKSSPLATEMLKVFFQGQETSVELWNHKHLVEVDCSENGEVLSVVWFKDKIFSGHSDGTIKVWAGKGRSVLRQILEVREHTKAVTSLAIFPSGNRLYSGSLDRTIRVWSIYDEAMDCIQVHDMKDQVQSLVVSNNISCFIPNGNGIKIHSWNGSSKLMNSNKYVRCLAMQQGRLYCGCQDNSIQEIDLATETVSSIQGGSRKLLGKASPIHALQAHGGLLYAASSSLDGTAVKILSTSDYSMVGSLLSTSEVRVLAISSELVYLGCKKGVVEIWDREKQSKIDTVKTGTNCKVLCLTLDPNEQVLLVGTSDGFIQAWGLS